MNIIDSSSSSEAVLYGIYGIYIPGRSFRVEHTLMKRTSRGLMKTTNTPEILVVDEKLLIDV